MTPALSPSSRAMRPEAREAGFTLVELAVVLVVIGLIIGGVSRGQEMIESARINRAITTFEELQAAHLTFVEKYGALPGDVRDDQEVLGAQAGVDWGGAATARTTNATASSTPRATAGPARPRCICNTSRRRAWRRSSR